MQPVASVCPLLLKVTLVGALVVPWVTPPNGIVAGEKLRLAGDKPVTKIPSDVVCETPPTLHT